MHNSLIVKFTWFIGDTLALSVQTPKHLKEIGLLDPKIIEDDEVTINVLFSTALEKLAFFPFAYIMDKWRWDVFDGTVSSSDYNCHWWKLRESYQGIRSPVPRSEKDFDPGAKYHIAANVEYIRCVSSFRFTTLEIIVIFFTDISWVLSFSSSSTKLCVWQPISMTRMIR